MIQSTTESVHLNALLTQLITPEGVIALNHFESLNARLWNNKNIDDRDSKLVLFNEMMARVQQYLEPAVIHSLRQRAETEVDFFKSPMIETTLDDLFKKSRRHATKDSLMKIQLTLYAIKMELLANELSNENDRYKAEALRAAANDFRAQCHPANVIVTDRGVTYQTSINTSPNKALKPFGTCLKETLHSVEYRRYCNAMNNYRDVYTNTINAHPDWKEQRFYKQAFALYNAIAAAAGTNPVTLSTNALLELNRVLIASTALLNSPHDLIYANELINVAENIQNRNCSRALKVLAGVLLFFVGIIFVAVGAVICQSSYGMSVLNTSRNYRAERHRFFKEKYVAKTAVALANANQNNENAADAPEALSVV